MPSPLRTLAPLGLALAAGGALLLGLGAPTNAGAPPPSPPPPRLDPVAPVRAILVDGGTERLVDAGDPSLAGYTLVDLSDGWTPYIFTEPTGPDGQVLTNRYRAVYLGLANDTGDPDGQPLPAGQHNYLEVYGIPPSLSVLRARFLADGEEPCRHVDWDKLRAVRYVPYVDAKREKKEEARALALARKVTRGKASAADREAYAKVQAERAAFAEVEERLACEGLLSMTARSPKHTPGRFDEAMRTALVRFQLKNKLYDAAAIRPDTLRALARTPLENDWDALVRTLTERVVAAADLLEDGTSTAAWTDAAGQKQNVRDLVGEATRAALDQLGLDGPQAALAFFRRHPAEDFAWLRAAVKLPAPPEYYGPMMDLTVEIDRGDVIYEPPFDPEGKPNRMSRDAYPSLRLYVNHNGQRFPLVKWRTTIGGWRLEQAPNGYEYFRYKGSDVGPRIWRNIVSAPVWIAPVSTPLRSLVKWKRVNGQNQLVVNYAELGPGYLSAYGLVVAYNVEPGRDGRPDGDNGVRVHGSSEYRSIRNPEGYSHGCHRLMNHLAVRLFTFVLRHRNVRVDGERRLGYHRQFLWKDDVYELRLPTRGFWYTLEPPVPVNVLEGNILGSVKKPFSHYVPKPGVTYPAGPIPAPPDTPEGRAGGGE